MPPSCAGSRKAIDGLEEPAVEKIAQEQQENAFQVLIATMLSAQTQDAVTAAASRAAVRASRARRARMAKLTPKQIEQLIYPVSFYRQQGGAREGDVPADPGSRFGGRVPSTMEELLTLPGVGRKTANLVLILAHRSGENICVDTHVHRISNRLGWVATRTPEETEQALYAVADRQMVAGHQPVSGDVGAERLPAGVSAVRQLRARRSLPEDRRHEEWGSRVAGGWRTPATGHSDADGMR